MSKLSIIKRLHNAYEAFKAEDKVEAKFIDAKLVDGTIIRVADADAFKTGDTASYITEDGEVVPAKEGMHELEDGTVLVIDGESKITEITKPEVKETDDASTQMSEKKKVFSKVSRDKFTLITEITKWSNEVENTTFAIGERVYSIAEDGSEWTLQDGEYELEDGTKIFLDSDGKVIMKIFVDGRVEAISAAPTEEVTAEATKVEEMDSVVADAPVVTPKVEDTAESTEEDAKELSGIVANLKDLIKQVKDLKSQFADVEKENKELKGKVEAFAKAPSATPTSNKIDFNKISDESHKSVLHQMLKK